MNALAQVAALYPLGKPVHHPAGWSGVVTPPTHGPRARVAPNLTHLPDGGEPVPAAYDSHLAEVCPNVPIVHVSWLQGGQVLGRWYSPWVFTERDEQTPAPLPVPAATVATVERLARTRGKRGGRNH